MKPPPFVYVPAVDLEEVVATKQRYDGEASVLAGGQSLIPMLNFRLARPSALIDLSRVAGLRGVQVEEGVVRVGAMTRQRDLERDASAMAACPLVGQALAHVAHVVVRNQGTVGGSIAHADAAAELPAALLALGGEVTTIGAGGERKIPAAELFEFHLVTSLAPDEVLTAVAFPMLPPGTGTAFVEFSRRHGDYALAGVAAAITLDGSGAIAEARLACCGIAPTPVRADEAERLLAGHRPTEELFAEAARAAGDRVDAIDEEEASVAYRRQLVAVLAVRALRQAVDRTREGA